MPHCTEVESVSVPGKFMFSASASSRATQFGAIVCYQPLMKLLWETHLASFPWLYPPSASTLEERKDELLAGPPSTDREKIQSFLSCPLNSTALAALRFLGRYNRQHPGQEARQQDSNPWALHLLSLSVNEKMEKKEGWKLFFPVSRMTRSEYNNQNSLLLCRIFLWVCLGRTRRMEGNYFQRWNHTWGKEQTVLMIKLLSWLKTSFPLKPTV